MQRSLELQSEGPTEGPSSTGEALGRIESLIKRVVAGNDSVEGREAAEELKVALGSLPRSRAARDLLQRLLDSGQLDPFADLDDIRCRATVIEALIGLGYPWALEVSPEDLDVLRQASRRRSRLGLKSRVSTVVASCVSAGWSLLMLGALSRPYLGGDELLLMAPFAVGLAHAVAAFVTAIRSSPRKAREERQRAAGRYRFLGWAAACGPIFSGIAEFAGHSNGGSFFLIGMLCATPAMITALCCAAAGAAIKPRGEVQRLAEAGSESPGDSRLQPE